MTRCTACCLHALCGWGGTFLCVLNRRSGWFHLTKFEHWTVKNIFTQPIQSHNLMNNWHEQDLPAARQCPSMVHDACGRNSPEPWLPPPPRRSRSSVWSPGVVRSNWSLHSRSGRSSRSVPEALLPSIYEPFWMWRFFTVPEKYLFGTPLCSGVLSTATESWLRVGYSTDFDQWIWGIHRWIKLKIFDLSGQAQGRKRSFIKVNHLLSFPYLWPSYQCLYVINTEDLLKTEHM